MNEPKEVWVVEKDNGTWWNFEFAADNKPEAETFVQDNGAWRYRIRRYIPAESECICGHRKSLHVRNEDETLPCDVSMCTCEDFDGDAPEPSPEDLLRLQQESVGS